MANESPPINATVPPAKLPALDRTLETTLPFTNGAAISSSEERPKLARVAGAIVAPFRRNTPAASRDARAPDPRSANAPPSRRFRKLAFTGLLGMVIVTVVMTIVSFSRPKTREAIPQTLLTKQAPLEEQITTRSLDNLLPLSPVVVSPVVVSPPRYEIKEVSNSLGMKLIYLDPAESSGEPQSRAGLAPIYVGRFEVSRQQFAEFVQDEQYRTIIEQERRTLNGWSEQSGFLSATHFNWQSTGFRYEDNHPVVNVTWQDAEAFCAWLSRKEKNDVPLADHRRVGSCSPRSTGQHGSVAIVSQP